jgi:general secretion pathway protein J
MIVRNPRRGLTLLEILVSITILGMIGLITWQTLATTTDVRLYIENDQRRSKEVDSALSRIERDLSLAFLTKSTTAVNTYQTVFIGRDEADMDVLFFATKAHQRTIRNTRECDQAEITLWAESDPDALSTYVLYHREAGRIDQEPDVGGTIIPILRNVTSFDLKYLDPENGEWRDDWDSTGVETPNRLPRAIQLVISVQYTDPDEPSEIEDSTFVRTIMLETAPEITQSLLSGAESGNSAPSMGFGGLSR